MTIVTWPGGIGLSERPGVIGLSFLNQQEGEFREIYYLNLYHQYPHDVILCGLNSNQALSLSWS